LGSAQNAASGGLAKLSFLVVNRLFFISIVREQGSDHPGCATIVEGANSQAFRVISVFWF